MELSKDILEFIQLLNQNEVEYLVVGGWAVGLHGKPRYTRDIDILINREKLNAEKMMRVIEAFGFSSLDISENDFLKSSFIIQLGVEPNRIDILTDIAAVNFDDSYKNKIVIEHKGIKISIIGIEDLIKNKEKVARGQDLVDAKYLRTLAHK